MAFMQSKVGNILIFGNGLRNFHVIMQPLHDYKIVINKLLITNKNS